LSEPLNLIDGMDGLLGSVGVILSLALAAMACLAGHWWAATIAFALAGSLLGFLHYNLPPASIFMGDSGSMLVGLILGTLAIECSLKAPATIAIAMPVVLLILPIFDTTAAIIRRKLTGRSIYTTDRGHLHHCLLRKGFSAPGALSIVCVCCLLACGGVLASQAFNNEWIAILTAGSIIGTLVATRLFGHAEAMLIKGRFLSLLLPTDRVRHMEVRLQGSAAWKDLWQALKISATQLNLDKMLLDVNAPALHEGYHARWDQIEEGL
jgi:UDP-GlcNAc:undecaprenyl-phosphate GlcNAc-1-phosphate transferase